jgi:phosphate-selective porin OprO/OprP
MLLGPPPARAQGPLYTPVQPPPIDDTADAAEADGDIPRRRLISWNEYEGPYFTVRVGGGLLFDAVTYDQDEDSEEQLELDPDVKLRDFRFLFKGKIKFIPRLSYTIGYMYDANEESWRFRQTGFMIEVPELWGRVFIGRTKEGISMNKLMVGYQGWTMERATANDAFVPILADGVKWMGTSPGGAIVYSLGWFGDQFSEKETFNKFDTQGVARAVWLPFHADAPHDALLHLGLGYRWAKSNDGFFVFKSKPESFPAQSSAIDTGRFAADHSNLFAPEVYYRRGSLVLGFEYFFHQISSTETHNPFFHGGEVLAAYLVTGEVRPYNRPGAYFDRVSPLRPVFTGGWGAWELVARFSYTDLDDQTIEGGKFWRITPMVNWHMSDNVRVELSYGYGVLDRFDLRGGTHFFGTRLQFQL